MFLRRSWWSDLRRTDYNKKMIDVESSKAELLQSSKCSSGDITTVILTFTWEKPVKIWHEKQQLKLDVCKITLTLDKKHQTINQTTKDME